MTERSLPHQDGVGDGGPYSAEDWHLILETVALAVGGNIGVVPGILNELAVTSTGDNNITVDTGRALTEGVVYESDASESKTTNDPGGAGTTGRRCVLRLDVAARTVRIAIITSADDVTALPALTQSAGVTWEIPLAGFQIAPSGAITELTDEREFTPGAPTEKQYVSRAATNRYSAPGWEGGNAIQAISSLTDRIVFQLIIVPQRMTFDRIAIELEVNAGAGEKARVGIYTAVRSDDGYAPGTLIIDGGSALAIDAGAITVLEDTIDEALSPGPYFLALTTDATSGSLSGPSDVGSSPVIEGAATAFGAGGVILLTDADAGEDWANAGLPATAPAVTSVIGRAFGMVQLRDTS